MKNKISTKQVTLFEEKEVRRTWHDEQWYFSIIDIIAILSESQNPRRYWSDLKRKLIAEGYTQLYEEIVQLKLLGKDGKQDEAADKRTLDRITKIMEDDPERLRRILRHSNRDAPPSSKDPNCPK